MSVPVIEPATINRRFVAYLLDGVALGLVALFVVANLTFGLDAVTQAFVNVAIVALAGLAYFALSWTQLGASPFQWLLGMRTLNAADGALITPSQAVRRWAFLYGPGELLSVIALIPGASAAVFLSIIYAYYLYRTASRDPQRRGFHDHQSGTIVVRSAATPTRVAPSA